MSASTELFAKLSGNSALVALVSDRIYPMVAPSGTESPWVVFQKISDSPTICHEGASSLNFYRYQVSAYSLNQPEVEEIGAAIIAALDGEDDTSGGIRTTYTLENSSDTFDEEARYYGVQIDFLVSRNQ
jgi:hypothetical protein